MGSSVILFGWNRPIPGREKLSAGHFDEFVQYLGGLQKKGGIHACHTASRRFGCHSRRDR